MGVTKPIKNCNLFVVFWGWSRPGLRPKKRQIANQPKRTCPAIPWHARRDSNTAWGLAKDLAWEGRQSPCLLCKAQGNHTTTGRHDRGDGTLAVDSKASSIELAENLRRPASPNVVGYIRNSLGPGGRPRGEARRGPAEVRKDHLAKTNSQGKQPGTNLPIPGMPARAATRRGGLRRILRGRGGDRRMELALQGAREPHEHRAARQGRWHSPQKTL